MEIMGIDSVEVSNRERGGKEAIDREKVCPFLLRCFWVCNKRPNSAREYNARDNRGEFFKVPPNEVKIYVWRNSTLREISHLLQDYIPPSRHPESVTEYGVVYPDRYGDNVLKFVSLAAPFIVQLFSAFASFLDLSVCVLILLVCSVVIVLCVSNLNTEHTHLPHTTGTVVYVCSLVKFILSSQRTRRWMTVRRPFRPWV